VAERYDGDRDKILEVIQRNVANGSQGNWAEATGGTPMPPQPQAVGKTDKLERISAWIADLTP
jgi:cytochrome c